MINVSIVLYNTRTVEIEKLLHTLHMSQFIKNIYLIDNSPIPTTNIKDYGQIYIFNKKNLGYGAAHNIALKKSIEQDIAYHLVINSDIEFHPEILEHIVVFMNKNADIGHLMPKIFYPSGQIQYLCKLIPTPFDLLFRRFLPVWLSAKSIEKFELRSTGYNKTMDVPYLSGCFMFLRVSALKEVGLFDERFFMYPEDIDLTRRIHQKYRTIFFPEVSVIHNHAQDSYKNSRMLWIHIKNMMKYFNKWGWLFDNDRRKVNKEILKKLQYKIEQ